MQQTITLSEARPMPTPVPETEDAALLAAEVLELRVQNAQLSRALSSRAVIDRACGMLMILAPCSGERAWDVLVDVSQHSNVKLKTVAAALVATAEGDPLPQLIGRELRPALRRLRATGRG